MKHLRTILTSVAVLAIVTSALAFTGKFSTDYCVILKTSVSGACDVAQPTCTTEIDGKKLATGSTYCLVEKDPTKPCDQQICTLASDLANQP